jgi:iron complex outermembrane receptor protein
VKKSTQIPIGLSASIRRALHMNSTMAARATWLLVAAMTGASGAADAQQATGSASTASAADQNLSEVVVVGIRASIESAIKTKKESDEIVEVISAEDIGKLPDTSIAESISRLPGLTSQRSDGRASDISIRGTDPQFATALLNGRQQVSTGDNRSIEYDQYPSELISSVLVYKTPDASLVGQGLAGTIALQTTRPLEYGHQAFAINVRGEKNSDAKLGTDSKNNGYRASFSYIDQFFDHTLGLTIGYARLSAPIVGKELGTYDPWHTNGTEHAGVPTNLYVTDGIKSLASSGTNRRDGSLATLEWKPNDSFTSILDTYYTKATEDNDRRSMEVNLGNYPNTPTYSNLKVVGDTLVGATINNLVPLARNFSYLTRDQIFAAGWNNQLKAGHGLDYVPRRMALPVRPRSSSAAARSACATPTDLKTVLGARGILGHCMIRSLSRMIRSLSMTPRARGWIKSPLFSSPPRVSTTMNAPRMHSSSASLMAGV